MFNHTLDAIQTPSKDIEVRIGTEIRNIGIPPRPSVLCRMDAELGKDEPDFRLLAEIVGSDVALAASVIKISNSPFFGLGKRVRSIPDALLVLGLKTMVTTVAGVVLQQTFPHLPSLDRFWDAAAKTARVSAWLALQLRRKLKVSPDDAYTFGLFRDCGIPLIMIPFPDYALTLKHANADGEREFTAIEDEVFAINHAIVGAELVEDWRLPEDIALAIRHHHDRSALADDQAEAVLPATAKQLIAISQTAEYLIQQVTGMNRTQEWAKLGEVCLQQIATTAEELALLETDVRDVVNAEV